MASIDVAAFRAREAQGLLTGRPHPTHDLIIWNYTLKCQFTRAWDDVTTQARGLITTPDGVIVARPFRKFFNYGEMPDQEIPHEPFKVTRKADGSLGIVYQVDGVCAVATRGSFKSQQALHATAVLQKKYADFPFDPASTYLFEIVFPANRYVVDYDDMDDLILLAIRETETGRECNIHDPALHATYPFPVIEEVAIDDFTALCQIQEDNAEGFVVCFASGLRFKIKFDEYTRLFKIMTSTSNRTIWEHLKEGRPLAEIIDHVPPAFEAWVRQTSREFDRRYHALFRAVESTYKEVLGTATIDLPFAVGCSLSAAQFKRIETLMKKRITERFADYPEIEHYLFLKWTGAKYYYPDGRRETTHKAALRLHLWDALYPAYARPFIVEGEEVVP